MSQNQAKPKSWLKWVLLLCIVLGCAFLTWWFAKQYLGINQTKYLTVSVEEGPIVANIRASGTLNPVRSVTVGTGVSGMIRELTVDFNDKVKQGQVIAKIDQREFQARYDQAAANYELALKNHEYNLSLMQQGFISKQALVTTDNTMKAALGALDLAKKSLDDTLIRSPVDGVVVKRSVEVGQTVAASLQSPEIFIIARNLAEMQVETSIDESDVGRIEEGQEATFTVDAFPNKIFSGKVKQVRKAPVNIQNVVTYTVLITADNPDLKLLPGMTANARIVVEKKEQALKILNTALRFRMPPSDKSASANKTGKDQTTEKLAWWKFWASKESASAVAGAKKDSSDRPTGGFAGGNSSRSSRFGSGQSNFRSVYVLEKEGNQEVPVRKAFRLGLTDGEYSEILPLRDAKEAQLKVGDLVISGIEGQAAGAGAAKPSGPRMF
ncbi:efflux RND transporter periplasmic adaptor subunit [Polynucleobacter kasalickyi]|uniref:HlyD family secretion protein n=1 Tax=Polynucleobacter kasalickyi TaxID=1938817 RepID=A0A1W1Y1T2_9BURK|nr:efflux RND transporter periplasmic adaptor subunit [Polynucleobacter kasalickyi]SMC30097.1 HlyD family secretion protein [Polynucleobacter kasalickyi]